MKWNWMLVLAFSAAVAVGCTTDHASKDDDDDDHEDKEQVVTLDQLPPAVRATLLAEAGGGKIDEIEKEDEDGKIVYEADVIADGVKWEIVIAEDGKLIKKALDDEKDDKDDEKEEHKR